MTAIVVGQSAIALNFPGAEKHSAVLHLRVRRERGDREPHEQRRLRHQKVWILPARASRQVSSLIPQCCSTVSELLRMYPYG
jgi:hypothetical protein